MKGDDKVPGRHLPTMEDFHRVILRQVDDEDPARAAYLGGLFNWYVESLLPCVVGCGNFSETTRRSTIVSDVKRKDVPGKSGIPPSSEAMVFILLDNNHKKWQLFHKYREEDKKPGYLPKFRKDDIDSHVYKGKWSDGGGSSPFGGWSTAGINYFYDICVEIRNNRKENRDHVRRVETQAMEALQQAYHDKQLELGMTQEDLDAQAAKKNRKRSADPLADAPRKRYCEEEDE